ncbi:MAG TPA: hypothetical protein VGH76_11350 [Actinomycetospora sp.]|jgi:hypothetical protein|uniref:hypothetical protein n=1 Tax=Actinomycetospora sp. TaxID=1872135 RepID=UPI002F410E5B
MTTTDQTSGVTTATSRGTTRWGPAWVGAVVALPVYLVLQLLFVAFGWIALGVDGSGAGTAASIVSAVLAIIALFVGGLAAGTASASERGTSVNAALQGAMVWALTAVGVLAVAAVGGAAVAGNLGGLLSTVTATGPQQLGTNPGVLVEANQAIQNGAGWAALWLGVAFVAAIAGTTAAASATGRQVGEGASHADRSDRSESAREYASNVR